jgi:methylmalonyl-CoA/ethylmalonyl-CoA epimerase
MVRGLLAVTFAVESTAETLDVFDKLFGLPGEVLGADTFYGSDHSGRVAFPNGCWLHVMDSQRPSSPIRQHIATRGPGLERVVLLIDDPEAALERVRQSGAILETDGVVQTSSGRRLVVSPESVAGVRVELLEPASGRWLHDAPPSISGVLGLQHIGVATVDIRETCDALERLFGLRAEDLRDDQHGGEQMDAMIKPGNDRLWLHATESWGPNARVKQFLDEKGPGLEHLCIEVSDIREAVVRVTGAGVPIHDHKIFTNRADGFEAFVCPEHTSGVTIELIEPYPTSRGYRPRA